MKRIIFVLMLVLGITVISSCVKEPENIPVSAITLNTTSVTLSEGETTVIEATVSPSTATNKLILWTTNNSAVATVSNGVIKAIAAGSATITAVADDNGKNATCAVTVNPKYIKIESVSLDKTSLELTEGEAYTLTATVKPDNATNKNVTWRSSNESVATVSNGKVTALKAGTTTITVETEDGEKTAECLVTITEKTYAVESVSLNKSSLELTEGEAYTLTATVKPDNATNKNVTWRSSNERVATVSNGKVSAIKAGTATITVETEDGGKTAECSITITEKFYAVESVSLNKSSLELTEGESYTLTATVKPDNATNKNVTWRSSNEKVATVSNGKVTALKAGTTTITVKTEDGGFTATCTVSVILTATSIKLSRNSFMGSPGKYYDISVEVTPENAVCDLHWTLFNSSVIANIVNISEDSRTATIRMSSSLYSSYAGIKVVDSKSGLSKSLRIYEMIEDFTWTEPSNKTYGGYPLITIAKGEQHQLQCSYYEYPLENVFESLENFVFYEPTSVVSQPSCIKIDSNGIITGVKTGTVGIKPTGRILKKSGGVERVYIKVVDEFEEEHRYVDLGLSVKWAAYNVGATREEQIGSRFAWGEVQEKSNYFWSNYKWGDGNTFFKYFPGVDNCSILKPTDDAATTLWGNNWRMPTKEEAEELYNGCTWTEEIVNGVYGYRATAKNSNSIFFPANGQMDEYGLENEDMVQIWTSECYGEMAYRLGKGWYGDGVTFYSERHDGLCIRAVRE